MNNDSNAVRGRHLESLANMFIGKITSVDSIVAGLLEELEPFTGATSIRGGTDGLVPAPAAGDEVKFLCGDGTWSTVASGSGVLDTVCPSVNGGLWYEVANGTPVVKIYYNGTEYPLGSGALEPTLTVAPSPLNVPAGSSASATISCDSGGNYLVTSLTEGVTAELVDNVITVAHVLGIEEASIKIRVMASSGFNAAEILLPVAMAKASPGLTVTPSANTTDGDDITASVSYSGGGTISVSSDNANVTPTYDVNTQTITVPYNGHETSATITVELTASTGYLAATQSFTVTMQPSRNLTISPATATIAPDGTATFTVSYDGGGTATLTWDDARVYPTYSTLPGTITVPYYAYPTDTTVTFTVSVPASGDYPAATATFTVLYEGVEELVVCMPFTNDIFEDLCGNTYKLNGTEAPYIAGGALYAYNNANRSIVMNAGIKMAFGGQDGTIRFWFNMRASVTAAVQPFSMAVQPAGKGIVTFCLKRNSNTLSAIVGNSFNTYTSPNGELHNIAYTFDTWAHFELDYIHDLSLCKCFMNGALVGTINFTFPEHLQARYTAIAVREGNTWFGGYVDEIQVYDGVALHTENFTPPARSST